MDVRAHVWIEGKVQGVSFRAYTEREAIKLGLSGWVRNASDGRVEAVFEGPSEVVEAMIAWCHRGSPLARVARVTVTRGEREREEGFVIRS